MCDLLNVPRLMKLHDILRISTYIVIVNCSQIRTFALSSTAENFSSISFNQGCTSYVGIEGTDQYKKFDCIYCIHKDKIIHVINNKKPSD